MNTDKPWIYRSDTYSTEEPVLSPRLKKVLEIFSGYSGDRLLDVGCGDGWFTRRLAEALKAKEAYGIEISRQASELAIQKGIKAICMDLQGARLPYDSDYFDAIFCGAILEHLFDPDTLLEELFRVLKKGGICVITAENMASWMNRIALFLGYEIYGRQASTRYDVGKLFIKNTHTPPGMSDHIRLFTLRGLKALSTIYSFKIVKVFGVPKNHFVLIPFPLSVIARLLSGIPSLSPNIILVLHK